MGPAGETPGPGGDGPRRRPPSHRGAFTGGTVPSGDRRPGAGETGLADRTRGRVLERPGRAWPRRRIPGRRECDRTARRLLSPDLAPDLPSRGSIPDRVRAPALRPRRAGLHRDHPRPIARVRAGPTGVGATDP